MMAKHIRSNGKADSDLVEVKSKFEAEFRRVSVDKTKFIKFEEYYKFIEALHKLSSIPITICYTDPVHGDLLPINNDENYIKALNTAKPPLRILVQKKGESIEEINGYGYSAIKKKVFLRLPLGNSLKPRTHITIGLPEDFRRVSAIIDVDIVPETHRRVRLLKHGSDKPLGFYIRDGTSVHVTPQGLEKVPGIFISRLVPGGLAESTGLLAVNDEVLEVNAIEVVGKTLDQITDMMVANSSNLIITVKPANQKNMSLPRRGSLGHSSHMSSESVPSLPDSDDEIKDLTGRDGVDGQSTFLRTENDSAYTL